MQRARFLAWLPSSRSQSRGFVGTESPARAGLHTHASGRGNRAKRNAQWLQQPFHPGFQWERSMLHYPVGSRDSFHGRRWSSGTRNDLDDRIAAKEGATDQNQPAILAESFEKLSHGRKLLLEGKTAEGANLLEEVISILHGGLSDSFATDADAGGGARGSSEWAVMPEECTREVLAEARFLAGSAAQTNGKWDRALVLYFQILLDSVTHARATRMFVYTQHARLPLAWCTF